MQPHLRLTKFKTMEFTGRLVKRFDEKSFDSGFKIREFVLRSEEKYPQDIQFVLQKEKTTLIDQFSDEEMITVKFDLRGRAYNDRYYNSLVVWAADRAGNAGATTVRNESQVGSAPAAPAPQAPVLNANPAEDDDLPF